MKNSHKAFSYAETLMAILIISIAMLPALQTFRQAALNQTYAESRYEALLAARNLTEAAASALRRGGDIASAFTEESASFPTGFSFRAYVSDKDAESGYIVFGAEESEEEEFVPPILPQSGEEKEPPDLRIGEEIINMNSDISAEEKDGVIRVTFAAGAKKNFYYVTCEEEAELYFVKEAANNIFVEVEGKEGKKIEMNTAEGIYAVTTKKKEEGKFLVFDILLEEDLRLVKRIVRFL